MLIVDSQIHLWQNGKMSAHHRQIPTYSVDDALAEMALAGVDCAVIHPPSSLGEPVNALAVEAVRRHPDKFCILGHFDLQSPERESIVARWRERPGMLGFRFTFNQPHQKAWWTDGSLDWFWAAAERAGLPVGLLAGGQMAALAKIAERHPRLKVHIDHLGRHGGGTGLADDAAFADLRDMLALARFPNVAVKLSGAPSYASGPYPYKSIHGYLRQIFEAFGPERSFWGTDITRMPCSYRQCVTMFTEELPWLRGRDLERVMGGAVVDWLGWTRPGGRRMTNAALRTILPIAGWSEERARAVEITGGADPDPADAVPHRRDRAPPPSPRSASPRPTCGACAPGAGSRSRSTRGRPPRRCAAGTT